MLMLWTIVLICFVLWLLGFGFGLGGGLIHILLILAVVAIIINLAGGRRPFGP
jgi:hypothetical protein